MAGCEPGGNDPEDVKRLVGTWERKDEAKGEAVVYWFREDMKVYEYIYDANGCRSQSKLEWGTVNARIRVMNPQSGFVRFWAYFREDGTMAIEDFFEPDEIYTKMPEPVCNALETVQFVIGVWQSDTGDTIELNADMSYAENGVVRYESGVWQTCNNEVQLLEEEVFVDWWHTRRYIISGDELVCYPGFAESMRYRRVADGAR